MKENEKIEVQVLVHTEDACEKVKELIEERRRHELYLQRISFAK